MKKLLSIFALIFTSLLLVSCNDEKWTCTIHESGKTMYSVNTKGELGGAQKGCSCDEIRAFEYDNWGEVDEDALKADFGC